MKSANCILLFFLFFLNGYTQVTPNSKRFEVANYIALDGSGKYAPYKSHGYVEQTGTGVKPRLFLMPVLELDLANIKYIDSKGYTVTRNNSDIISISIPVTASFSYPNESQKAAVGAAISSGTSLPFYYSQIVKDNFGMPVLNPVSAIYHPQIIAMAGQYDQILARQQVMINAYADSKPELVSLTECQVTMKIDNVVLYDERIPGTTISFGGSLDDIAISRPSEYIKNRIAEGNFSVLVKYKFNSSQGRYIDASVNASAIIDQYLSEVQRSMVSQRSSGWSFLGIGERKKILRSQFDEQVDKQYTDQRISGTTIDMLDADDQMISLFEDAFFPVLATQRAIENHIVAAEKARLAGNTALEKLHLDYVRALQNNDPNLEADIGKAVGALAKKDFIGFIANGVRWGDNSGYENSSFRRVLNSSEMTTMLSTWSQTKRITVQHAVAQKVAISMKTPLKAYLGMTGVLPFQITQNMTNGYSVQVKNVRGIILGPVIAGGTLHKNNIPAGTPLTRIGYQDVYDIQSLESALRKYKPGDKADIVVIEFAGPNLYRERTMSVTFDAYPNLNN